jgi:hypothetical protein
MLTKIASHLIERQQLTEAADSLYRSIMSDIYQSPPPGREPDADLVLDHKLLVARVGKKFAECAEVTDRETFSQSYRLSLCFWLSPMHSPKFNDPLFRGTRRAAKSLDKHLGRLEAKPVYAEALSSKVRPLRDDWLPHLRNIISTLIDGLDSVSRPGSLPTGLRGRSLKLTVIPAWHRSFSVLKALLCGVAENSPLLVRTARRARFSTRLMS